tara:strand:+ start:49 stop:453 length:405 start_codon:yes stop_codon:yes gene_type:complete
MKIIITILFLSLLSSPSWSQTFDDLVERDGVYYKKFSDVPFSGKVTGLHKGSIKNGKKEGKWVGYWSTGKLNYKGDYKNGKKEGKWVSYWSNGQLETKGNWKNDKKHGYFAYYDSDGSIFKNHSGHYNNGVKFD